METSKTTGTRSFVTLLTRIARASLLVSSALSSGVAACSDQKAAAAQSQPPSAAATSDDVPNVLATVGDEQITLADVRSVVGDNLDQMDARYRQGRYALIDKTLQEILRDRVLSAEAKKQGKTVDQLVAAEIGGPLEPTEIEVSTWYLQNKARVGTRSIDQLRPQIADYLRKERIKQATEKLDQRLNQERNVTIHLQPYRLTLNNQGAPAMGPANAQVTLVEFSDFQCPYCGQFFPTLKQIEQKYADKVRIVYRQYPLTSLHPNAFKAAEASLCANEQGKFWELHDVMFQEQAQLTVRELKQKAGRLGLDQKKFDSCLESGRFTERVQEDLREGARVGVTGTPALFVNGVQIEGGAVGFDVVAKALDKELARAQR